MNKLVRGPFTNPISCLHRSSIRSRRQELITQTPGQNRMDLGPDGVKPFSNGGFIKLQYFLVTERLD